jgi:hypothetical protein
MLLADQKVREVMIPEEQHDQGEEGDFRWERVTQVIEAPDLVPVGSPPRWRVFEIIVRVVWDERRQVELATLRTVPAIPAQDGSIRGSGGLQ